MDTTITFYIARHGKTLMNTLERVQGWCDSPLTHEGIEVAQYLGVGLQHVDFRSAYSSDLLRTRQTARVVLEAKGQKDLTITEVEEFREACFGSFESGPNDDLWNDVATTLGYTPQGMYVDYLEKKLPYSKILDTVQALDKTGMAEDYATVETRTQTHLMKIAEKEAEKGDGNVLIVAHGVSIYAMLYSLGGDKLFEGEGLENGAICKVVYNKGKLTVESMGDMSYIAKGREATIN